MINVSRLYCGLAGQSDELRYRKSANLGPVVVYNCTNRCNLGCLHCYSSAGDTCGNELTRNEAGRLLTELAEMRCPAVLFSGGEALLRSDLFDLLSEAKRLGLRTVISTNGTLIDAAAAAKLADVAVSYVGISIDGSEQFNDQFRQRKGAFAAAMAGFENCTEAGLRTGLRLTITAANYTQIADVFEIAADKQIRRICFYSLIRSGRARELDKYVPNHEQAREAMNAILDCTAHAVAGGQVDEVLTVGNHADGPYLLLRLQRENSDGFQDARKLLLAAGGNKTGEGIVAVASDGTVHPDQFWRNYSLGNIRDKNFREVWTDTKDPVLMRLRDKSHFAHPRCRNCRWFDVCKGNYRFLGEDPADVNWLLEPDCYLTDDEIV